MRIQRKDKGLACSKNVTIAIVALIGVHLDLLRDLLSGLAFCRAPGEAHGKQLNKRANSPARSVVLNVPNSTFLFLLSFLPLSLFLLLIFPGS